MSETKNTKKPTGSSNKSTGAKSRSSSSSKPKTTTKVTYDEKSGGKSIADEILAIVIALIAVLVFVSLVSTSMGIFGEFISTVLKGIFGSGAYLLPVIVVGYCIWYVVSRKKQYAYLKLAGVIIFLVALCAFLQYVFVGAEIKSGLSVMELIRAFFRQVAAVSGGVVGGVTVYLLNKVVGKGTIIVLLVCIVISVIMATGKSCFSGIAGFFRFMKDRQRKKEAKIKAQAEYIKEKEEDRRRRQEKKEEKAKNKRKFFDIQLDGSEGLDDDTQIDLSSPIYNETENTGGEKIIIPADKPETEYVSDTIRVNDSAPIINEPEPEPEIKTAEPEKPVEDKKEATDNEPVEVIETNTADDKNYVFPPIDLLEKGGALSGTDSKTQMLNNAKKLEDTLKSFGVDARVVQINKGPTITRYELSPSQGVKVSKIVNLADDIALNLASSGIRIEAPIPGKAAVGIEVPNKETQAVYLREVIDTDAFRKHPSKLAFALGKDIAGNPVVTDIAKMPHLLIAGATGSGKSVCINTLITSILYKAEPSEVKLLLIDPKVVELSVYNGIPHLLLPVVTDPKKAAGALNWAVREMLARYNSFSETGVRDITGYNQMKKDKGETDFMPKIVIVIDELADLMMAAPGDVEDSICRLAQMARAAGMHLVIATQRPSVDVITGTIKANIPSRLAFAVSSGVDSRTILDMTGAEKLVGKGDMLFYPMGKNKPERMQGAFISDKEVEDIVDFVKGGTTVSYDSEMIDKITQSAKTAEADEESDEFFDRAVDLVVEKEKASVSMLQRQFRIGYNRAARLMEELESKGIVGPEDGSKPRKVLITRNELIEMRDPSKKNDPTPPKEE